jgi:hypothetical protein
MDKRDIATMPIHRVPLFSRHLQADAPLILPRIRCWSRGNEIAVIDHNGNPGEQHEVRERFSKRLQSTAELAQAIRSAGLGSYLLCGVEPLVIQNLYATMLERGLSARTVRYLHAVVNSALKQAVKWRRLARNPA